MAAEQPFTEAERAELLAEIEAAAPRLHPFELMVARDLAAKPLDEWCADCYTVFRAIHDRAMGKATWTS